MGSLTIPDTLQTRLYSKVSIAIYIASGLLLIIIICKVLEHIIKDHLLHYFNHNNFFTSRQHGFRPFHSCVTQLIQVMEDWTSVLESGHQVDVVYLDLQKAFDSRSSTR